MACKKHAKTPVKGYSDCVGCEIEYLRTELAESERKRGEAEERASHWADIAGNFGKEKDDALARMEELTNSLQQIKDESNGVEVFYADIDQVLSRLEGTYIIAHHALSLPTTGAADRLRIEELQGIIESVKSKKIGINNHDDYSDLLHDALCNDIITSIRSRITEMKEEG